jgi:hypothetical protein
MGFESLFDEVNRIPRVLIVCYHAPNDVDSISTEQM